MSVRTIKVLQRYLRRLCDEAVPAEDAVLLQRFITANDRDAFELLIARREQATLNEIVAISRKAHKVLKAQHDLGAGFPPDVLRANVELQQNLLKLDVAIRRVKTAEENLRTAVGRPAVAVDLTRINPNELRDPPDYDWNSILTCVQSSTELQEARALIA